MCGVAHVEMHVGDTYVRRCIGERCVGGVAHAEICSDGWLSYLGEIEHCYQYFDLNPNSDWSGEKSR